jgi:PAS domain S-box-containing protein
MSNVQDFPKNSTMLTEYEALVAAAPNALDAIPGAVYLCDHEGYLVRHNTEAAELWGRLPTLTERDERFCGSYRLFLLDGTLLPHNECPMAEAVRSGTTTRNAEVMMERPDGSRVVALVNIRALRDNRGNIQGAINCFQDITAQKAAEQELQRKTRDLDDFFENSAVGLHIVSAEGIIIRANKAELDLLGYTAEEYIDRHISEFHADAPVLGEILHRLSCGEGIDRYPARLRAKDGSIKHVLITSNGRFENGKFINTRCFTTDITDLHEAEDALRETEERLAATYEAATVGISEINGRGQLLRVNNALCKIVGHPRQELLTKTFLDYTHEDDRDEDAALYARQVNGEFDSYSIRKRGVRPDGTIAYLDVLSSSVRDTAGCFRYGVRVIQDVTEAKRMEDQIRDGERHMRELLEALPAAVYTTDAKGRITFYNKAAIEMAGRVPEPGDEWCVTWRLYRPDGTPLPHNECPMAVALKENRPVRGVEAIAERPDGRRVPFIPYPTPLRDAEGNLIGAINMLVDISERKASEAKLRAAHEQLDTVLKTARVGLWEADLTTGKLQVSPTGKANFGLPPEAEFTHETMVAAMHPDDRPLFDVAQKRALAGEAPYEVEYRNFWPDGSQHWIFTRASILRDTEGEPARIAGLSLDVTERRRAEQALRASEERLGRLLHLAPLGIAEIAPNGRIVYANAAAERILRLKRSEIERRRYDSPDWHVMTPEGLPIPPEDLPPARALRGEPISECEVAVVGADGYRVIISVNAMPVHEADGTTTAVLVAFTDVTARQEAEQALKESEERFRTLANNILQLAWMANPDGGIVWYNQRWYEYTGTTPPEMEGWGWQSVHNPEILPQVLDRWRKSIATREPFEMVFPIRGHDGVFRPFLTRVAPVRDDNGRVIRWFGTNTDISEQRRIEDALRASERNLQQLNETLEQQIREAVAERERIQAALFQSQKLEAIGQLTGGVAHDFNNLLTAIIGSLDILNSKHPSERSRRHIETAMRAAQRGATLTQQLLAYGRRQHLQWRAVNLNRLVQGLGEMLERTLGGLIDIEMRLGYNLWHVRSDPTQLELAILNLAINARDAMPLGGTLQIETSNVTVEHGEVPELDAGEYVHIAIRDTGEGMSPEVLAKAMDPFFTTKEIGKGSGLGLSQVYGVVKQCSGTIQLKSVSSKGTAVLIWLPRSARIPDRDGLQTEPAAQQRGVGTILVVDDDPDVRYIAAEILKEAGYRVEEAESGPEGLRLLTNIPSIELAVVDYAMPRMSGTQFMQMARKRNAGLPVVYISGYADPGEIAKEGDAILVKKPYRAPELLTAIKEALSRKAGSYRYSNVVSLHGTACGKAAES